MANCGTAEESAIRRINTHYDRKCRELSRPRQHVVADTGATPELTVEQAAVNTRYRRLDEVRERAVHRLREALATRPTTPQSVGEREAAANFQTARLAALDAAESGLVFGRLDLREDSGHRYVGRIGLSAEGGAGEPLLVAGRARAARPSCPAAPPSGLGCARRRHIRPRVRGVHGDSAEVLDPDDPAAANSSGLTGE